MQKLADGHDTDTTSSLAWLRSRWAAAPQDCPVLDCAMLDCAAVDGAAGDDPSHPVAAPVSRTNAHASAGLARLILFACLVSTVRPTLAVTNALLKEEPLRGCRSAFAHLGK
jgi:hypothetical protein